VFKIGRVSKLCRVSVKTLRCYDVIGLLRPSKSDRTSGYRMGTPKREMYVRGPADEVPPEWYLTEIQLPIVRH
jgi:MerR family regulatory protein